MEVFFCGWSVGRLNARPHDVICLLDWISLKGFYRKCRARTWINRKPTSLDLDTGAPFGLDVSAWPIVKEI